MVLKGRQYASQRCMKYRNWPKCGQKLGDSVPMYIRSNVILAQGEESGGSSFHGASHQRHTYASPKGSMTSDCETVMVGRSVGH